MHPYSNILFYTVWQILYYKAGSLMLFPICLLQLPSNMYKKILVILHDSILPNMSNPTLMIDFLTAAYDVGE